MAACHSEPAKLAGTKWVAEMIGGQPVAAGVNSTLAFDDAANVSGNGACNGYGGGVQIEGSSLRFAPLRATKMACAAPAAMSQENRFFAALDQVRSFRMDGPKLETARCDRNRQRAIRCRPLAMKMIVRSGRSLTRWRCS